VGCLFDGVALHAFGGVVVGVVVIGGVGVVGIVTSFFLNFLIFILYFF
jgi:hypothetical protein